MANIPVERTGTGVPPWLWLVGALLLGLLAWFLISALGDDEDDVVVSNETTEVIAAPADDAFDSSDSLALSDDAVAGGATGDDAMEDGDTQAAAPAGLAMLEGDLASMAGQTIALDRVRVTGVTGDSTFTVGDGAQRTVVVMESLGEGESGSGDGSDGVFDISTGDTVTINGTVRAFQRGMRGTTDMTETEQAAAETRRYVIVTSGRSGLSKQ